MTVVMARDLPALAELADERFAKDPSFAYRAAHAHPEPGIFRMPNGDGLIATSHRTLTDLMKHPAVASQHRLKRRAGAGAEGALSRMDSYSPFFMNPPEHLPIAMATYRPMSPARNRELVEAITAIAHRAVDDMLARGEVADLRRDYAHVIARDFWIGFLGLPAEAGQLLEECSAAIVPMLKFENSAEEVEDANHAAQTMRDYLEAHHRTNGGSGGGTFCHIFESVLAGGEWSEARRNAATTAASITFDGIDSATAGTANVLQTCLGHPDQWALLEDDPGLIHDAWREALRLEPAFVGLHRGTHEEIEYEGVRIPDGINLMMGWGAANRDPRVFEDPDRFDIRRPKRRSLHFGGGSRVCKGRHLAMRQGEIALRVLLGRLASIELLADEPDWGRPGVLRSIQSIPARLQPR